jgi:Holliday junction resolvasome RuvABC ATP-dependent DNA helicase subunit
MDKLSLAGQLKAIVRIQRRKAERCEVRANSTRKAHITREARQQPTVAKRLLLLLSDGNYHTSDELCRRAKIDKHQTFYTTIRRLGDRIEISGPVDRRRYRIA